VGFSAPLAISRDTRRSAMCMSGSVRLRLHGGLEREAGEGHSGSWANVFLTFAALGGARPNKRGHRGLGLGGGHLYGCLGVWTAMMAWAMVGSGLLYRVGTECLVYASLNWVNALSMHAWCSYRQITTETQMTDPTSRQRGRPTDTRKAFSDRNLQAGNNVWS
jgi:hypothetical protein